MKKIQTIKHDKIWGFEIWLFSPLEGLETPLEDGSVLDDGPLVKIINAKMPLSVQVHPDDELAMSLEGEKNGKSESWYIIDNDEGAELIMGLKTYDNSEIRNALKKGEFEELLNKVPAKKGDFFNIPSGLVHGVGYGNNVIFEVQQPSDTTYRYYDYKRLENGQERELHIDKAIQSQKDLSFTLQPLSNDPLMYANTVGTQKFMKSPTTLDEKSIIVNFEDYSAYIADANEKILFTNYVIVSF